MVDVTADFICPQCSRSLGLESSPITCCGKSLDSENGIINLLGPTAYVFSKERDSEIAELLVQTCLKDEPIQQSILRPAVMVDAVQLLRKVGLKDAEIDQIQVQTPIIQVVNNAREYFCSPSQRLKTPTLKFISSELQLGEGDHLLDIGCSAGRYLLEFADSGACLTGIDLDGFALQIARHAWRYSGANPLPVLCVGSVLELPFRPNLFSHVTAWVVLGLVPISKALTQIRHTLQPGGTFAFTIEGPGFLDEMWQSSPTSTRASLLRWWLGNRLMSAGVEWQGRKWIGRIAGLTQYSAKTIERIVAYAGYRVEKVEVLTRFGGAERLIGVVAKKA
jgi:ubiquinone/menaquinone biosynthesis C-methylase UbiE